MNNIKEYRRILFLHLDGLVLLSTVNSLIKTKLINQIVNLKSFTIKDLKKNDSTINEGYLNVALRLLRTLDFLDFTDHNDEYLNQYKVKKNLTSFLKYENLIVDIAQIHTYCTKINFLNDDEYIELSTLILESLNNLNDKKNNLSEINYHNLEGAIIAPLLSHLSFNKNFIIENNILSISNIDSTFKKNIYNILEKNNFINAQHNLTEKGFFFISKCSSYGVTVSYLPMLNNISELLIGNCNFIWNRDNENNEIHVNRSMNVWGSGGAHKTYFKKIDQIIEDTFNQKIEDQPKGVIDIGCGDGTFLQHIYNIITTKTIRKDYLDTYPLHMIGTDINKAARVSSRSRLNKNNINNVIINGNISEPSEINNLLKNDYNLKLIDFLNTRSFLDHNRIFEKPKHQYFHNIKTTGVFCFRGKIINGNTLINNLIEHLRKWSLFINKHGLILLELHTIDSNITKNNLGKTLSASYDTTHGYSDQYLVEHKVFIECCKKANLNILEDKLELFPNKDFPTVSINYIK